jgi:pentalenene oxygenase
LRVLDSLPAHGDLVEVRLGPRPALVICHPDLARQVLADFRTFDRAGPVYDRIRRAMGNGLATAARSDHRRQRLIMQPAFRREYMAGYAAVMNREITATMDRWHDGQLVDLVDEMFRLTTGVALRALFSARIGAGDAQGLRSALDVFLKGIYARAILPVAAGLPVPGNLRFARALAHWRGQVRRLIEESRRSGTDGDDLMSRLIKARDDENQGMSDRELSDQVAVLLLAGGETTSVAVVWAMHLLTGDPQVLRALHAEVDAVLGGRVATWEDLPRLGLTARVVHEALRLYPPAWAVPRTCVRETTLAGRTVRAGTMVVLSPYVLHRRDDLFPQPQSFDPDRWLTTERGAAAARRGAFLPFGTGATKCIGEDFALAEAVLILSSVAACWDLTPKPGTSVSARPRSVLTPGKLPVYLTRRGVSYSGSA